MVWLMTENVGKEDNFEILKVLIFFFNLRMRTISYRTNVK
jgi:hypothetical protein